MQTDAQTDAAWTARGGGTGQPGGLVRSAAAAGSGGAGRACPLEAAPGRPPCWGCALGLSGPRAASRSVSVVLSHPGGGGLRRQPEGPTTQPRPPPPVTPQRHGAPDTLQAPPSYARARLTRGPGEALSRTNQRSVGLWGACPAWRRLCPVSVRELRSAPWMFPRGRSPGAPEHAVIGHSLVRGSSGRESPSQDFPVAPSSRADSAADTCSPTPRTGRLRGGPAFRSPGGGFLDSGGCQTPAPFLEARASFQVLGYFGNWVRSAVRNLLCELLWC